MPSAATLRRIRRLREEGKTNVEIAARVGLSKTHVSRCLNPRSMESTLRSSRDAKRRRKGTCEVCGGETHYGGSTVSRICAKCKRERDMASRYWTRERVIAAIKAWADEYGTPPRSNDWDRSGPNRSHPPKSAVYVGGASPHAPFRSWADAIEAAGFPRPRVGPRPK